MLEEKLEGHTDWVRDVAWCPSVGLPVSRIASCSQDCKVMIWSKDETVGGKWNSVVSEEHSCNGAHVHNLTFKFNYF